MGEIEPNRIIDSRLVLWVFLVRCSLVFYIQQNMAKGRSPPGLPSRNPLACFLVVLECCLINIRWILDGFLMDCGSGNLANICQQSSEIAIECKTQLKMDLGRLLK